MLDENLGPLLLENLQNGRMAAPCGRPCHLLQNGRIAAPFVRLSNFMGNYSVELSAILACWLLVQTPWLPLYFAGFFTSQGLNRALKMRFGSTMPSGHFQQLFYSFIFALGCKSGAPAIFWVSALFLAAACLSNCLIHKYHTPGEMLAGSVLGGVLGSAFSYPI
jgi:hypothetical protein